MTTEIIILCIVAFGASLLTFFSGFGLSTLLTPAFVLFFPLDVAIGLTAIIHFLNNAVKVGVLAKDISRGILLVFGLPAMVAALGGSLLLDKLLGWNNPIDFNLFGHAFSTDVLYLLIGGLMIFFALIELAPSFSFGSNNKKTLVVGGLISGFFGGLSGHQGAFRSAFLVKFGLKKEVFIATGTAIAIVIDISRLGVYMVKIKGLTVVDNVYYMLFPLVSAVAAVLIGKRLIKKITIQSIQYIVSAFIFLTGVLMILGVVK